MLFNFDEILSALKNAIETNGGSKEDYLRGCKTAVTHDLENNQPSYAMAAIDATLAAERFNPNWDKDKLQEFTTMATEILETHEKSFDKFYDEFLKEDEKPAKKDENADLRAALKSFADLF